MWLLQKGSPESKELDKAGRESDEQQKVGAHARPDSPSWVRAGGWRLRLYSRSLGLTMGAFFALSWLAQLVAGRNAYSSEQLQSLQDPAGWREYATSPDFWNRTFQNGSPSSWRSPAWSCSASSCANEAHRVQTRGRTSRVDGHRGLSVDRQG